MVRQREGIPEESFEEEKEPQPIQRIPRINVLSRQQDEDEIQQSEIASAQLLELINVV
jgi:hypothetical protein